MSDEQTKPIKIMTDKQTAMSRKHRNQKQQAYAFATAKMSQTLYESLSQWERYEVLDLCYQAWMKGRKSVQTAIEAAKGVRGE